MKRSDMLDFCTLGGSAIMAVEVLISRGVPEERILFLNLIASPEGIENFATKFPKLRVVTAFVDQVCESVQSRLARNGANHWMFTGSG
jgi:uracil phosphoribosyltransferase